MTCSVSWLQQPHSIVQRRLMAGNIPQLRGEARVGRPSPLVDSKEGGAGDAEEKSESTADDSTEESERSLETRSDEEEDSSEAGGKTSSTAGNDKTEEGRKDRPLTTLLVQCKVRFNIHPSFQHHGFFINLN